MVLKSVELKTVNGVGEVCWDVFVRIFFPFFNAMNIGANLTQFFRRMSDSNVNPRDSTLTQLNFLILVIYSNWTLVRLI